MTNLFVMFVKGVVISMLGLFATLAVLAAIAFAWVWPLLTTGPNTPAWAQAYVIAAPVVAIVVWCGVEYVRDNRHD